MNSTYLLWLALYWDKRARTSNAIIILPPLLHSVWLLCPCIAVVCGSSSWWYLRWEYHTGGGWWSFTWRKKKKHTSLVQDVVVAWWQLEKLERSTDSHGVQVPFSSYIICKSVSTVAIACTCILVLETFFLPYYEKQWVICKEVIAKTLHHTQGLHWSVLLEMRSSNNCGCKQLIHLDWQEDLQYVAISG